MADPAWSDVKSLNHWDGADGATISPDQVAGVSWTFFGDARLEDSRGVFGSSAALECGGTNATGRVVGTGIPNFGTGDFAIQFTLQGSANASARVLFDQRPSSTNGNYLLVYVDASNKLGVYVNSTQLYTSGGNIFTGSVRQIGIKRIGGTAEVWIDNSQDGAGFALAASLSVGAGGTFVGGSAFNPGTQAMAAWLDEFRIVTGASADIDFSVVQAAPWPNEPSGPVLTNPAGAAAGPTSADWSADTDSDTGTIYVIASQSTTKPSALQIKAGEDHTGSPATWSTNQSVTTTGTQSGTATGLSAGTWYFHFLWNDGSEDSAVVASNSFTLEAGWAITQQPVNATVYAYDNAEFRAVVSDPTGTATFQWYRVESGGNTPIAGETADVLVIASAALDDDGSQYLCVASRAGEADLTTNVVTLTVVARSTQVLPGSLHRASYPSFFPCATWQFDQQIGPEVARTRFSSGWTRQRKQWREEVSTGTLSFSMPTTMFDNWSRWMMNNGYQWFTMFLDRFFGVRALYEVRLTSRIDWNYRNHDVIDAAVRFELGSVVNSGEWDGLPDTEAPPDFGPDEDPPGVESRPECKPYACDAYDAAMIEGAGAYWPLTDPTYGPIPQEFLKFGGGNYELIPQPDVSGQGWDGWLEDWSISTESDIDPCNPSTKGIRFTNPGAGFQYNRLQVSPHRAYNQGAEGGVSIVVVGDPTGGDTGLYLGGSHQSLWRLEKTISHLTQTLEPDSSSRHFRLKVTKPTVGGQQVYRIMFGFNNGGPPVDGGLQQIHFDVPGDYFDDGKAHLISAQVLNLENSGHLYRIPQGAYSTYPWRYDYMPTVRLALDSEDWVIEDQLTIFAAQSFSAEEDNIGDGAPEWVDSTEMEWFFNHFEGRAFGLNLQSDPQLDDVRLAYYAFLRNRASYEMPGYCNI